MPRLPTPVVEEMEIIWPEDHQTKEKNLYSWIGQAIRKAEADKKKGGKGRDETD